MNLDATALENARVIELLVEIRDALRRDRHTETDQFLESVLVYTGTLLEFTVGELLEGAAVDAPLRQALGDLDSHAVGRELAARQDHVVLGRRLVKRGRSGEGNRWRFEPA